MKIPAITERLREVAKEYGRNRDVSSVPIYWEGKIDAIDEAIDVVEEMLENLEDS